MKITKRKLIKIIKEQTNPVMKVPSPLAMILKKYTGLVNMNQIWFLFQLINQIANIMIANPFNQSKFFRLKNMIDKNFPLSERDRDNLSGTSVFGDMK